MSAKSVPVSRREDSEPSAGPGTSLGDGLCRLTSDRGDPGTPNLVSLGLPTLQVQYSTVQYSTVQVHGADIGCAEWRAQHSHT